MMAGRKKHRSPQPLSGRRAYKVGTDRIVRPKEVDVDWSAVDELRTKKQSNTLPVTHQCHECGRPVSGERRFCGPCLSKHPL